MWKNFAGDRPDIQSAIVRTGIDLGIDAFDLANNYGPPAGATEDFMGGLLARQLRGRRDELVLATKAGYQMWEGPYGSGASRKHLLASLDQSLRRLQTNHVDIFYSHCADPQTPVEETADALASAVHAGKVRYVGVSSYSPPRTRRVEAALRNLGVPLTIHQPSYSLFNRWIEGGLLATLEELSVGCAAFSPLAQGLLTSKYLDGIPADSRASRGGSLTPEMVTTTRVQRAAALQLIAERRGQTLAQLALAWVLRDARVTTVVTGASSVEQLRSNVQALDGPPFSAEDLDAIERQAVDDGINLWEASSRVY